MRKPLGLRTEILATITVLVGAALLLGGGLLLRSTEQGFLDQRLVQQQAVTEMLAVALVDGQRRLSIDPDHSNPAEMLQRLPQELQVRNWWLYDQNLRLLGSYRSEAFPALEAIGLRQLMLVREPNVYVNFPSLLDIFSESIAFSRIAVPLMRNNSFYGIFEVHFSLADIRLRILAQQHLLLVYVLLYGIVLVAAGYSLLQRNIIRPARQLLEATEEVGRGELATRLPVGGPHEIARLAESFNHMVEALKDSREETRNYIVSLQEINAKLQVARDEVIRAEKLASVGQLAAGLAHELGNPLAALIGYLEYLKHKIVEPGKLDILQRSLAETERIDFMVRELLDFSRPSESVVSELDIAQEVQRTLELLCSQGALADRKISNTLNPALPPILMDRQKFQQVLINLLLNAVQATESKGEIRLFSETEDEEIRLMIVDTGVGIADESLGRIFDPFFTTKEPGQGTGLGLAICHRLMAEVDGEIRVDSTLGQGSHFCLVWRCV